VEKEVKEKETQKGAGNASDSQYTRECPSLDDVKKIHCKKNLKWWGGGEIRDSRRPLQDPRSEKEIEDNIQEIGPQGCIEGKKLLGSDTRDRTAAS